MSIERIDPELCTGCGICINSCPMDVIRWMRKQLSNTLKNVCAVLTENWIALQMPSMYHPRNMHH